MPGAIEARTILLFGPNAILSCVKEVSMPDAKPTSTPGKKLITAKFSELVAVNFQIDPKILEPRVPRGLELDFFHDETYVSLVAMMLRDVRVWGIPIHIATGVEKFNLRFYVRRRLGDEIRRGSCFIKDYVSSGSAAWILGSLYKSDFHKMKMKHDNSGFDGLADSVPSADYSWKVNDNWNRLRVKGLNRIQNTGRDTKHGFFLDHDYEYAQRKGKTLEYSSSRPKWTIWNAAQASFQCDVKQLFGLEFAKALGRRPASVFLSRGSDVTTYRPATIN